MTLHKVNTSERESKDHASRSTYFADLHVQEFHSKGSDRNSLNISAFVTSLDALEVREVTTKNGTKTRSMSFKNEDGESVTITLFEMKEKEQ
jgi:hypothetical protein